MARSHSKAKGSARTDSSKKKQGGSSGGKSASKTIGKRTICGSVKRVGHPSSGDSGDSGGDDGDSGSAIKLTFFGKEKDLGPKKGGSGKGGKGDSSQSGSQSGDSGDSGDDGSAIKLKFFGKEKNLGPKKGGSSGDQGDGDSGSDRGDDSGDDGDDGDEIGRLRFLGKDYPIKNPFKGRWGRKKDSSTPTVDLGGTAGGDGGDDGNDGHSTDRGLGNGHSHGHAPPRDAGGVRRDAALAKQLEEQATLLEALAEANRIVMMGDPTEENIEIADASNKAAQRARALADMHKQSATIQNFKFGTVPEPFERGNSTLSDQEAKQIFQDLKSWGKIKETYADDPNTMAGLWAFRKKYIDTLINGMRQAYPTLIATAAGSTDLTSDYDLTVSVVGDPAASVKVVEALNEIIRSEFGAEGGTVFDTNFYRRDYNSNEMRDKILKDGNVPPGANLPSQSDVDKLFEPAAPTPGTKDSTAGYHRDQDVLALMKLRRYADDKQWNSFKQGTLDQMKRQGASPQALADAQKRFDEADSKIKDFKKQTDDKIRELGGDPSKDPHSLGEEEGAKAEDLRLKANNLLYVDYLKRVADAEAREQALVSAFSKAESEEERQSVWKQINDTRREIFALKGDSLYFAAEAYHSAGAVIHIVEGLQGGGKINAPLEQLMQSFNEQFGDFIKDSAHYDDDAEFFYRAAKYAGRMAVAMRDYFMRANGIQPDQLKAAGLTVDDILSGFLHLSAADKTALERAGIKLPLAFTMTPEQKHYYQMLELMTNNTSKYLLAIRKGISKDSGPDTKDWYTRLTPEQKRFWASRYVDMFSGAKTKAELVKMLSELAQAFNASTRNFNHATYDTRSPPEVVMPPPPPRERGDMIVHADKKHEQQPFVARARGSTN